MNVLTPSGYRDITSLVPGDEVCAFDEITGAPIVNLIQEIRPITADYPGFCDSPPTYGEADEDGNCELLPTVPGCGFKWYLINGTWTIFQEQSIWSKFDGRIVHGKNLQVGDTIWDDEDHEVVIDSIEETEGPDIWWQLAISGDHSYIADGLTLHNASRYWVGSGSANTWAATANTNWSASSGGANNATVPGTSDLCIFDSNSGSGNSVIGANITVQGLDCTGGTGNYAGTITHNASVTLTINTGAASSVRFSSGMTYTPASFGSVVTLTHTSGTANITCNGKKFFAVNINGAGGTTQPLDAFLCNFGANAIFTLTAGTFDANNFAVSAQQVSISPNNTRTLTMGSGLWTIGGSGSSGTIWNAANTGTLTFNKNTANIKIAGPSASSRTFTTGGLTYNDLTIDANASGGAINFTTGGATFANLNISGMNTVTFPSGTTTTLSNAPTWTGGKSTPILIMASSVNSAATISVASGTVSLSNGGIKDITGTGGATFNASPCYDFGGNTNWNITPPDALTLAGIATAVWQDTTAGDFTVSHSIGKSLYIDDVAPGAASGHAIVGSDMNASKIAGSTNAATNLSSGARGSVLITVGTGSTTTSIVTSSQDPAASVADQFKGRTLVFLRDTTTAHLRGQVATITANTSGGTLTVSALTDAPVNGDTAIIV